MSVTRSAPAILLGLFASGCSAPERPNEMTVPSSSPAAVTAAPPAASTTESAASATAKPRDDSPCVIAPVRREAPAPVDDGEGPQVIKVTKGTKTFDAPMFPGKFQKLHYSSGGSCLLRESGELTCMTTEDRLKKRPKDASVGPDDTDAIGSGVVKPGRIVHWGEITLPKGPFRDLSGSLEHGCAITPEDRVVCWGENKHVRAFGTKMQDRKIASVAVHWSSVCAIDVEGALLCLEGLDGTPKPNRKLLRIDGKFGNVDLRGFDWAVRSDGTGARSATQRAFDEVDTRAAGCFSSLLSDGFNACGIERGRVRCVSDYDVADPSKAIGDLDVQSISPGHRYYCVMAQGRATCFGDGSVPGGALSGVPARDVGGDLALLCIIDEAGAFRCRGEE